MKTVSNFETCRAKAQRISFLQFCVQHVNLVRVTKYQDRTVLTYCVSDWYDCDSTELSYANGEIY